MKSKKGEDGAVSSMYVCMYVLILDLYPSFLSLIYRERGQISIYVVDYLYVTTEPLLP